MIPFVLLLFPIVRRIVYRIGLPWVKTAERYSELWRQEFERWLDEEHDQNKAYFMPTLWPVLIMIDLLHSEIDGIWNFSR
jgi:hypothetical protein